MFDKEINRYNTNSLKYDFLINNPVYYPYPKIN